MLSSLFVMFASALLLRITRIVDSPEFWGGGGGVTSVRPKLWKIFRAGDLGYVYTGSNMFRSVWDQIHCGMDPLCLHGSGSKLER